MPIKLSVIVPWCDRPDFEQCLERNGPWLKRAGTEVIVVNCGGDRDQLHAILGRQYRSARHIIIKVSDFNKSLALNIGAAVASGTVLFLLDADVIVARKSVEMALRAVSSDRFATIATVIESERARLASPLDLLGNHLVSVLRSTSITFRWRNGRSTTQRSYIQDYLSPGTRAGPGLLFVTRKNYRAVGGFVSDFKEWGWEDLDFAIRAKHRLRLSQAEVGEAIHLSHGDDTRTLPSGG